MKRLFVPASLLIAACSHSHVAAPKAVSLCDGAAATVAKNVAVNSDGTETLDPKSPTFAGVRAAVVETCHKDAWSSSASTCYRDSPPFQTGDLTTTACAAQLTATQREHLNVAVLDALLLASALNKSSDIFGTSPGDSLGGLGGLGGSGGAGGTGAGNPGLGTPNNAPSPGDAPAPTKPEPERSNPDDGGGYTPK